MLTADTFFNFADQILGDFDSGMSEYDIRRKYRRVHGEILDQAVREAKRVRATYCRCGNEVQAESNVCGECR